jgi:lauroyl/myristoyl acyltransferase
VDVVCRLDVSTILDAASRLGRVLHRVRDRPRLEDVRSVFRDYRARGVADPDRLAREIYGQAYRGRMLMALARRHGVRPAAALLRADATASFEPFGQPSRPVVLATWHFGPPVGLAAAFDVLETRVLALARHRPPATGRGLDVVATGGSEQGRASALWRAVQHLKAGRQVLIAADGQGGERTTEVACLGRVVRLARGPFVLARLSGAPIVPLVPRWDGGRIAVHVGAPIDPAAPGGVLRHDARAFEAAAAAAMAAWIERCFLEWPADMRPQTITWLARSPRV